MLDALPVCGYPVPLSRWESLNNKKLDFYDVADLRTDR